MTVTTTQYEKWLIALTQAACELVPTTFGFDTCAAIEDAALDPCASYQGAFVPLVTHDGTIHIGILTTQDSCELLARAFLGFEPDETLPEEDMADAFREIANILGGMCKSAMKEHVVVTNLGLPILIKGCEQVLQDNSHFRKTMQWGSITCAVAVFQK